MIFFFYLYSSWHSWHDFSGAPKEFRPLHITVLNKRWSARKVNISSLLDIGMKVQHSTWQIRLKTFFGHFPALWMSEFKMDGAGITPLLLALFAILSFALSKSHAKHPLLARRSINSDDQLIGNWIGQWNIATHRFADISTHPYSMWLKTNFFQKQWPPNFEWYPILLPLFQSINCTTIVWIQLLKYSRSF